MITSNNSPNYQVIAESIKGILFKNKRDRKLLNVDPHVSWIITIGVFVLFYWNLFFLDLKTPPGDNSTRFEISTPNYTQLVLYDHITRRKT